MKLEHIHHPPRPEIKVPEADQGAINLVTALAVEDPMPTLGDMTAYRSERTDDYTGADFAIMGVPDDLTQTMRTGQRGGPRAFREASLWPAKWLWAFDHTGPWPWEWSFARRHKVIDAGDVSFGPFDELLITQTQTRVREMLDAGVFGLFIGGAHSVPIMTIREYSYKLGQPLSVIQFDAHPDAFEIDDLVTHGNAMYLLSKEGCIDLERSVSIGIRTPIPDYEWYSSLKKFNAWEVVYGDLDALIAEVKNIVGDNPTYITFDLDCLDPGFAPGVADLVPGGPTSADARRILYGLKGINAVGGDVCELSPLYDHDGVTAFNAAYMGMDILQLMSYAKDEFWS